MKISSYDFPRSSVSPHRRKLHLPRLLNSLQRKAWEEQRIKRVALLIDAENISSSKIGSILEMAQKLGDLVSARVYGPPSTLGSETCLKVLESTRLKPVVCKGCVNGKNSVDIRMVVDSMDLAMTDSVDVFAIASADSDFLPLVNRLHKAGKKVVGFSCSDANRAYMEACDEFLSIQVNTSKSKKEKDKSNASKPYNAEEVRSILCDGITRMTDSDGWCSVARLAVWVQKNYSALTPKSCGKKSFKSLLGDMDEFEVVKAGGGSGFLVRLVPEALIDKKKAKNL